VKYQSEAKNHKNHVVVVQNVGMCKAYPTFGKTSSIFHIFIERFLHFFKIDTFGTKFKLLFGANVVRGATHAHNHDAVMITDIPSLR
jgi:hypothetical protein